MCSDYVWICPLVFSVNSLTRNADDTGTLTRYVILHVIGWKNAVMGVVNMSDTCTVIHSDAKNPVGDRQDRPEIYIFLTEQ
jgi:hypothetical protein